MALLSLQNQLAGALNDLKEPFWKLWLLRRKRTIREFIKQAINNDQVWVYSGLGAQCVCGLVDALQSPGKRMAIRALRQIGTPAINDIFVTLPDED